MRSADADGLRLAAAGRGAEGRRCRKPPGGSTTSRTAPRRRSWPPSPLVRPAEPPPDIAHLPRPLLGYVGSLEDRVDWELMDRLSHEFPDASIVVVGRTGAAGRRALVGGLRPVPGAPQRPRHRLAAAGGPAGVLPGVRRLADPLSARPSVQPGVQPDEDHGRDGLGPADRRDGHPRVPAARRAVPRRRGCRRVPRRGPRDPRPAIPTTAARRCGTRSPSPTPAAASASGSLT